MLNECLNLISPKVIKKQEKIDANTNEKNLKKWRDERPSMEANYKSYFTNIVEEILEPLYSKATVKILTQKIVNEYYKEPCNIDKDMIIDTICDVQVFSINEAELMEYDNSKAMSETIKEISSREQDPYQKTRWKKHGSCGEKWMKDQLQKRDTLYKANYQECKR